MRNLRRRRLTLLLWILASGERRLGHLIWLAEVNPLLPVIIITGRCKQRELAEKAGADALMDKPLDVPRLLQMIRELIDEPLECRAQRASYHPSRFRYSSCDHELFFKVLPRVHHSLQFPRNQGYLTMTTNPASNKS